MVTATSELAVQVRTQAVDLPLAVDLLVVVGPRLVADLLLVVGLLVVVDPKVMVARASVVMVLPLVVDLASVVEPVQVAKAAVNLRPAL